MAYRWTGPLVHHNVMTGDRRMFTSATAFQSRPLPVPMRYSPFGGHDREHGVDVGGVTHVDFSSSPVMGAGFFLPEDMERLVKPAIYKARMGINGLSPDMEPGTFTAARKLDADGQPFLDMMHGVMMAATLVSMPAFGGNTIEVSGSALTASLTFEEFSDAEAMDLYALVAAGVNGSSWNGSPIAPRDAPFSADKAIQRIRIWANGEPGRFSTAFLWQDPQGSPTDLSSYRLPIGDIIDGKLTVIYHAIYAAAALIQGAHGGLPGIGDADKSKLRNVINSMYKRMSTRFGEDLEPPWDQGAKNRPLSVDEEGTEMTQVQMTSTGDAVVVDGLVAGGGPLAPSRSVFEDPQLGGPTRVTITPEGKVVGHVANWGVCHTGIGNVCVEAPKSKTNYAKFHQGTVLTLEGDLLPVGKITLGGGHADTKYGIKPAIAHYDDSTTAVAVVRAGEDEHGIWISGSLVAGVTPERIAELRRSPLSGDWRYDSKVDNLELIAALAVNSPGFPIVSMVAGTQMTLVAAGMVLSSEDGSSPDEAHMEDQVDVAALETAPAGTEVPERAAGSGASGTERIAAILAADQVRRTQRFQRQFGISTVKDSE